MLFFDHAIKNHPLGWLFNVIYLKNYLAVLFEDAVPAAIASA
jgi:hypothetical protein